MHMNIRPFEIGLIAVFAVFGIVGIAFLSQYESDPAQNAQLYGAKVVIWGTLEEAVIRDLVLTLADSDTALDVVSYKQIDARAFNNTLVNAIAEGKTPDLIILPHSLLVTHRSKLQAISYETLTERTFRDTYIDGADIMMRSDGVYGIPFAVDPMVMYWNKDIFSSSGLAVPPATWETLINQTTRAIVRSTDELGITQSAVAFGEYDNIAHAKEILSMLLLQSGSTIVEEKDGYYEVTLNKGQESLPPPGETVMTFYTQFSSPTNALYSWNRSKNQDATEFSNGTLGMYFAPGSEGKAIERKNPNLNFDMTQVPQGGNATTRRNYGEFYAFAIPRASQNINGAFAVAQLLAQPANAQVLADGYGFAPVHRSLYGSPTNDPFKEVIYQSALIARGWLDPSPSDSSDVFRTMVQSVSAGRTRVKSVIMDAAYELEALFR